MADSVQCAESCRPEGLLGLGRPERWGRQPRFTDIERIPRSMIASQQRTEHTPAQSAQGPTTSVTPGTITGTLARSAALSETPPAERQASATIGASRISVPMPTGDHARGQGGVVRVVRQQCQQAARRRPLPRGMRLTRNPSANPRTDSPTTSITHPASRVRSGARRATRRRSTVLPMSTVARAIQAATPKRDGPVGRQGICGHAQPTAPEFARAPGLDEAGRGTRERPATQPG